MSGTNLRVFQPHSMELTGLGRSYGKSNHSLMELRGLEQIWGNLATLCVVNRAVTRLSRVRPFPNGVNSAGTKLGESGHFMCS